MWRLHVSVYRYLNFTTSANEEKEEEKQIISYTDEESSVMEEIFKLPKDYRNIIYLYYYEGYTVKEIAEILGKNQNTVNSKLQRGRKKLKNLLVKGEYVYDKNLQKCT